ncbi:MAG: zinc ribbon domain-containing protein [Promethearchaeota archaeon]
MILNPYLLYYITQKQQNCPRCYQKVTEKNLEFHPFGEKKSEIYSLIIPQKNILRFHCPYCGKSLNKEVNFCNSCGKKIKIKW